MLNSKLPKTDLRNVTFVSPAVQLGTTCSWQLRNHWRREEVEQIYSI